MTTLYRHQTVWTGFSGAPGYTTLYSLDVPPITAIKAFYTSIKTFMAPVITWTIKGSGDTIEDSTGDLNGAWSAGADLTEVGAGANAWSAASGCVLRLTTTTVVNSHRVKGRLFLVPGAGALYTTAGGVDSANASAIRTAGTALITAYATKLVVWARPFEGRPATDDLPAIAARAGSNAVVTGCQVPTTVAVLRSRRD